MAKRYVLCPFCGGKIKDTAIKCMHCKKWINIEQNKDSVVEEKEELKNENNNVEIKINKNDDIKYVDDKSILWWVLGFQFICILGAIVSYI